MSLSVCCLVLYAVLIEFAYLCTCDLFDLVIFEIFHQVNSMLVDHVGTYSVSELNDCYIMVLLTEECCCLASHHSAAYNQYFLSCCSLSVKEIRAMDNCRIVDTFDWKKIFDGATWFHITGITPAISQSAADLSLAAVKAAKEMGVTVSCDLNYRKNLWKYGKEAKEVMSELTKYVDVAIANEEDFQKSLGISAKSDVESGELDRDVYKQIAQTAMDLYPNLKKVAITLRESKSADTNYWAACIYDGKEFYVSRKYAITDIVDRVGGGDSFGGGLIYGLNTYATQAEALEFAVAASCLKHTISGDFNRVTVKEVESLMKGSGSGRVER